ncbi:MAG: class I SAM-dependent methyltransferase [Synergistaceae bacterium]|nr:class I SAM-dependent methyltransferase [Synergistaceae bacterium]
MEYLKKNKEYWEKGYPAVNVDHPVFRFYGRILRPEFKMGNSFERLLDFGCGQGAAVNFFAMHGFNSCGVDISESDIAAAKTRYPHIAANFSVCDPDPRKNDFYGFKEDVSVVTAIQSLYYFSDTDFEVAIQKIYSAMRKGGIFFATMMGEQAKEFFDNSAECGDGLRVVNFKNDRLDVREYYISFIKDEDHLKRKFSLFHPLHTGYYCAKYRADEGDGFHFTFCGVKK